MILKKIAIIVILTIFAAINIEAMPPHPSKTKPGGREKPVNIDKNQEPLYKSLARKSSRLRASGSSGTMHVLVILADFGEDLTEEQNPAAGFFGNDNNSKAGILNNSGDHRYSYIIFALLFTLLIVQIISRNKKRYILLNTYLLILLSCSDNNGSNPANTDPGTPLYFQTPVNNYKEILDANPNPLFLTMKKYYSDMSNNNLNLEFDIAGPFTVSKGWQYYGRNDTDGYDTYPGQFVSEAVNLAHLSGQVADFSKYDNNNDGYADTVIIIHAGPGEEYSGGPDTIWSHSWDLNSAKIYGDGNGAIQVDNVFVNSYTIQPEYNAIPGDSTIGVFCHEFGHVLGLPDLYDTTYETHGVGSWSLMSAGSWGSGTGADPAPVLAWERNHIGGADWVTIIPYSKTTQTINNITDIETGKTAYKIPLNTNDANTATQYLILERKTKSTPEDIGTKYVPASNILITHINTTVINKYIYKNEINNETSRVHGVNIVEAGNTETGGRGALWSSRSSNIDFKYQTMPFTANLARDTLYGNVPDSEETFHPNSNYYTNENIFSKTGYSDVKLTVTAQSSINIIVPPTP